MAESMERCRCRRHLTSMPARQRRYKWLLPDKLVIQWPVRGNELMHSEDRSRCPSDHVDEVFERPLPVQILSNVLQQQVHHDV